MHDHGQIYSGIEGASPGRFAALVTKHEVVTLGKLGEERAQALGRAPVAAMSGFQIAVVHDCPERVEMRPTDDTQLQCSIGAMQPRTPASTSKYG
jgi:hypothetical protein